MELIGQGFGQILDAFDLGLVDGRRLRWRDAHVDQQQNEDSYILALYAMHAAKVQPPG